MAVGGMDKRRCRPNKVQMMTSTSVRTTTLVSHPGLGLRVYLHCRQDQRESDRDLDHHGRQRVKQIGKREKETRFDRDIARYQKAQKKDTVKTTHKRT